jgi:hypothetical protein
VKRLGPLFVACVLALATLVGLAVPAGAVERNFAGSAQLDYQFVPTAHDAKTFPNAIDGFTMEFAAKASKRT